jgi:hypothetical protein
VNYIANISRYAGDPRILSSGPSSLTASDRTARCRGWFSIALGAIELAAPRSVARFLGMEGREGLLRMFGAREISTGIVSLSTEKQTGMWSRVAGDGIDLAALLGAYRRDNPKRSNVGLAIGMLIGIAVLDIAAGQMTTSVHARKPHEWRRYHDRSGFPRGVQEARGAARADKGRTWSVRDAEHDQARGC